ncbi:50S ribosome-binding GTPase, partial [bacterium]|nr:50S ribosome-binding GTPase [bacterium]
MMSLDWDDTIVALATPLGVGSRAILRLAGPKAHSVVADLLDDPSLLSSSTGIVAGVILRSRWPAGLACQVIHWPARQSSTAQPMAEIHLPASAVLASIVETEILALGIRLARPGEFTLRSFLAGRLDLSQAEGVLGLIDAEDHVALTQAVDQRAGGLGRQILAQRQVLLELLADIEAGLDFVEEDISFITDQQIAQTLDRSKRELESMIDRVRRRDRTVSLPRVVLIGPANAGKSSLFNAMARQTRAIVSPMAGTTRDWLSAVVSIDSLSFELIDTAGIEDILRPWTEVASDRRNDVVATADLLLWCQENESERSSTRDLPRGRSVLLIRTKSDQSAIHPTNDGLLHVSAHTEQGLEQLRETIRCNLTDASSSSPLTPRVSDALA